MLIKIVSVFLRQYLSLLVHCPMIIIVGVIPNIVEKSLILPGSVIFYLDISVLDNMIMVL
jgi:hypothetical protein